MDLVETAEVLLFEIELLAPVLGKIRQVVGDFRRERKKDQWPHLRQINVTINEQEFAPGVVARIDEV